MTTLSYHNDEAVYYLTTEPDGDHYYPEWRTDGKLWENFVGDSWTQAFAPGWVKDCFEALLSIKKAQDRLAELKAESNSLDLQYNKIQDEMRELTYELNRLKRVTKNNS